MTRLAGDQTRPMHVLVVDDSATQRAALIALLESDPDLQVIGWASNGAEAVKAVLRLKPDVVTMDLQMPEMDGLEATRRIMQQTPTPIVMVSATNARREQRMAFEAMEAGVMALLDKPLPGPEGRAAARELLSTVKAMAGTRMVRRWAPERLRPPAAVPPRPAAPAIPRDGAGRLVEVIAIGASTGGPQALQEILTALPATFATPVLVVQHISAGFESGLVDWLRPQLAVPISLAREGAPVRGPGVYVAPTGMHLLVRGRVMALSSAPPISGHRPSATALFAAIGREYGSHAAGVLLTGMGDDGAAGLRDMKRAGAITIAQDEASSVVFGMPAVAIGFGVVDHVLPPALIAQLLVRLDRASRMEWKA